MADECDKCKAYELEIREMRVALIYVCDHTEGQRGSHRFVRAIRETANCTGVPFLNKNAEALADQDRSGYETENKRLRTVLEWLDDGGGLGIDKHAAIRRALGQDQT
jgi:hypothetical protein